MLRKKGVRAPIFHTSFKHEALYLVPGLLTDLPFYKCAHRLIIKVTVITGQGFITAFGTKPLELPSAGGKPSDISYCQVCAEEEAVGSTRGSHKTFTMFPATTSPLGSVSSFQVASESQKLRSSIIRPQRRGQLPGLKATWVSHCKMTDWSDPVHEVPRSKRTALHCRSQGLKLTASWTSQSSGPATQAMASSELPAPPAPCRYFC